LRIENVFELFIITDPGIFKDEEIYISELLELGASGIYIRKENYSAEYIWNIFKKVDNKFHHKLIVPFAFYAEHKIKNFDAIIHFKENERTKENFSKIQRDTIMSTSIHEINERDELERKFRVVFYSPVFNSISKPNYKPEISLKELNLKIENRKSKIENLIALGGINEQNILQLKDSGFNGAALLGSIWKSNEPIAAFKKIKISLG
jgi:thiamine-phosphate pyrophosphorylase